MVFLPSDTLTLPLLPRSINLFTTTSVPSLTHTSTSPWPRRKRSSSSTPNLPTWAIITLIVVIAIIILALLAFLLIRHIRSRRNSDSDDPEAGSTRSGFNPALSHKGRPPMKHVSGPYADETAAAAGAAAVAEEESEDEEKSGHYHQQQQDGAAEGDVEGELYDEVMLSPARQGFGGDQAAYEPVPFGHVQPPPPMHRLDHRTYQAPNMGMPGRPSYEGGF